MVFDNSAVVVLLVIVLILGIIYLAKRM